MVIILLYVIFYTNAPAHATVPSIPAIYRTDSSKLNVSGAAAGLYYAMKPPAPDTHIVDTNGNIYRKSQTAWIDLGTDGKTQTLVQKDITAKIDFSLLKSIVAAHPSDYPQTKSALYINTYPLYPAVNPSIEYAVGSKFSIGSKCITITYAELHYGWWGDGPFPADAPGGIRDNLNGVIEMFEGPMTVCLPYNGCYSNCYWANRYAYRMEASPPPVLSPVDPSVAAKNLSGSSSGGSINSAFLAELDKATQDPSYVPSFTDDTTGLTFVPPVNIPSIDQLCLADGGAGNVTACTYAKDTGSSTSNITCTSSAANLKTGNYYHSQDVITKPASLSFVLSYNSLENRDTPLGKGWTHAYNISLTEANDRIALKLSDGDIINFVLTDISYLPEAKSGDTSTIIKNGDGSFTRIFRSGTIQAFNVTGQLTDIYDQNGNTTTLAYTGSDLATINDSTGRVLTFTSSDGRISSVKDPANRISTFTYTGTLLTAVTDPAGNSWQYTYDSNNRMYSKTDPAGNISSNSYDTTGRNTSNTDADGKTKTISYDSDTTSIITEKDGGLWTKIYDPILNAPIESKDPLGNNTRFTYDNNGNMLTKTDPNGHITSYTYDISNNLLTETDPLGKTTSYTYNNLGQVLTKTDPDNHTTTNSYDSKGNLLQTIDPVRATTVYTYDSKGNLLTITDPLTKMITMTYDASNNMTSVTDQNNNITYFTYDTIGNLLTRKDPADKITTFEYDTVNRLIKITDPLGNITQFTYDKLGNRATITDGNGNVTTYTYNFKSKPLTIKDALNNTTTMTYSGSSCGSCGGTGTGTDKLIAVIDASSNSTQYEYNLAGKLVKETDPKGYITGYSYDNGGRLISKIDGNANTTTFTYDAADRITARTYQDGTSDTFTYDDAGNLLTASNASISYTLSYDADNRLTGVTDTNNRIISYILDANNNRTRMTAPDGRITNYSYDAKNRLTTLTCNGKAYSFIYDNLDRKTKITNPNTSYTTYTYDADSRITALATKKASGTTINSITHTYDKTVNRATKVESTGTTDYTYDAIYQLIKSALGTTTKELFTFDVTGNRTTGPLATTTYTTGTGNQLTAKTGTTYTYDNNGNIITKTEGTTSYTFSYDGQNRLIKADKKVGSTTTTTSYKYDPFGRRIEKTTGSTTTKYLYDGANILYEYNASNTITKRYTHNLTIDDPLGIETGGKLYAYHKDTLGSIRTITDSTQKTVNTYTYDSFGTTTQTGTLVQPYSYTARELDKETNLYYYRARTYDPGIGRFIQRDPLSFAAGDVNLYRYVQNNPVNLTDPTGLAWFKESDHDYKAGRPNTIIPEGPYGRGRYIDDYVPAGHTFASLHDSFVGMATSAGLPDWLVNKPSMLPLYIGAVVKELISYDAEKFGINFFKHKKEHDCQ
jgi:RHS repeat-associated protein